MSDLTYLFEIKTPKGKIIYLTSATNTIYHKKKYYYHYSGAFLESLNSNDSGENIAIISGIYNKYGISKNDDLADSEISIKTMNENGVRLVGNLICTSFIKQDLEFQLHCNSEVIKYNRPLLKLFSKTCRANFGDDKCKINLAEYTIEREIDSIENGRVKCSGSFNENQDFTNGKAFLLDKDGNVQFYNKIIAHVNNIIEINCYDKNIYKQCKKIRLIPSCDKNYRTCCYSFDNSLNFRGEPDIPELSVIKN